MQTSRISRKRKCHHNIDPTHYRAGVRDTACLSIISLIRICINFWSSLPSRKTQWSKVQWNVLCEPKYSQTCFVGPSTVKPALWGQVQWNLLLWGQVQWNLLCEAKYSETCFCEAKYSETCFCEAKYSETCFVRPSTVKLAFVRPSTVKLAFVRPSTVIVRPSSVKPAYVRPFYTTWPSSRRRKTILKWNIFLSCKIIVYK